jgi:hypothetical protein
MPYKKGYKSISTFLIVKFLSSCQKSSLIFIQIGGRKPVCQMCDVTTSNHARDSMALHLRWTKSTARYQVCGNICHLCIRGIRAESISKLQTRWCNDFQSSRDTTSAMTRKNVTNMWWLIVMCLFTLLEFCSKLRFSLYLHGGYC